MIKFIKKLIFTEYRVATEFLEIYDKFLEFVVSFHDFSPDSRFLKAKLSSTLVMLTNIRLKKFLQFQNTEKYKKV